MFRPLLLALAALLGGVLLIPAWTLLTPRPELRDPVLRFVVENRSEQWFTRVELTARGEAPDAPQTVLASGPELPPDGRWVVERELDEPDVWGLAVDEGGRRHEFHAVRFRPHGELRIVTIQPGPCVRGERADVTSGR